MKTVNLAGLKLSAITKKTFLKETEKRVTAGQKTFVITPYSEFLYETFLRPSLLPVLNSANISVADGIGMLWAATFLNLPLKAKSYYGKILESLWQAFFTLTAILFKPAYIKKVIPEKIVGANLIWDLASLANKNNWSIYLLGGFADTAELAAKKLQSKYSNLKIAGWSNKHPGDPSIIDDINQIKPDMLFVAFGPIKQEKWIAENLKDLNVKFAIGLGGTFDYLAGKYKNPPALIRGIGLEWLWRLVTQPRRWRRIYNATVGLVSGLIRYKVFSNLPSRANVAAVILNKKNEILICERNPKNFNDFIQDRIILKDGYWQLPQGGIEPGEDITDAAKREAGEETGLDNIEVIKISPRTFEYTWNLALKKLLNYKIYRTRGQTQQIVFFKYDGPDDAVKIDNDEFIGYRWVNVDNFEKIVHPERQGLTSIVIEDLEQIVKT